MILLEKEFSKKIPIDKIGAEPITYKLRAGSVACEAISERLGIEDVDSFEVEVSLSKHKHLKAIYVSGHVKAVVSQACILSGEPVLENIDDTFESYFVANAEILESIEDQNPDFLYEDIEVLEEPHIDVAELATQYLSLFLNPYPKKEGVDASKIKKAGLTLKSEEEMAEELKAERNPFKVLGNLKKD